MAGIAEYIELILAGSDLTFEQAVSVLDTVFEGEIPGVQIAALLTALRGKGESVDELAGFASSLREHAVRVDCGIENLVDTCGTGGAKLKTFNISTAAAFVAAGAGVYVAKHGNRAITSKCGSADVLTALGVNVDPGVEKVAQCIREANIGFMFAPKFHPAMKYVQPIRKELGFRTVFNILGPLANPAFASAQVMGVPQEDMMEMIAGTLKILGIKRALVVHSDGLDEISTMGPTKVLTLKDGQIESSEISPEDFGIARADFAELAGADAETNATIVKDILSGKETGARKDIVVLNAAAAIIASGKADDFAGGIVLASESITSGAAEAALKKLVELSNA
ncbi:MAG: anthranilate phosphoribosyltransferase [Planctomycetes bacterium]|nr:anthranilate phosphoribosyltransferase [Planctomycetota bacterium]